VRLRDILWACLGGLVIATLLHSAALAFAALTASAVAALVVVTRRRVFTALAFERTPSRRVVSWGTELEITMSVTNDKLLPLVWLRVRDQWPPGLEPLGFGLRPMSYLGRQQFDQTVSVRWYERLRRHYRVRCVQRGLHRLGPVELETGDLFGISGVTQTLEAPQEFAVLPKVLDVPGFDLLWGLPLVEEVGERSLAHDPTALRGIRAYRPGDPLRAINWRATARAAALQTNEFDPASLAAVRLLLDAGSHYKAWEGIDARLMEVLCVTVASLASAFDARGYAIGLASNACLTNEWRTPDLDPAHGALPDVLETLARLEPYTGRDYGSVLAAELADEASTAACVLVTSVLRPPARAMVARLRSERPTTVVFVGRPDTDELACVDLVVPGDFDWRTSDALPLRA
jgi:uncharacterized protein (DUF58 family)